jgi:hypothetical protein
VLQYQAHQLLARLRSLLFVRGVCFVPQQNSKSAKQTPEAMSVVTDNMSFYCGSFGLFYNLYTILCFAVILTQSLLKNV